jgi:hypothetical protein
MLNVTLFAALICSQTETPEAVVPPATPPAEAAPSTETTGQPPPAPPKFGPKGADEAQRLKAQLPKLSAEEQKTAVETFRKKYAEPDVNPVAPPADVDFAAFSELDDVGQATVIVRSFFEALNSGDVVKLMRFQGLPFSLEDRKIEKPEELRLEWTRQIRAKRTDLLQLYGVKVLTPAEMEKQHGKPPARLSQWNWRAPKTLVALANVSGRARIVLLRQVGASWQIVGFHD